VPFAVKGAAERLTGAAESVAGAAGRVRDAAESVKGVALDVKGAAESLKGVALDVICAAERVRGPAFAVKGAAERVKGVPYGVGVEVGAAGRSLVGSDLLVRVGPPRSCRRLAASASVAGPPHPHEKVAPDELWTQEMEAARE
jgi:hypothetical protein